MSSEVYHCNWRELAERVPVCDAVIVDAPYSEKTHAGHNGGALTARRASSWAKKTLDETKLGDRPNKKNERAYALRSKSSRASLGYAHWGPTEVAEFVAAWAPRCTGWIVSLTDDVLAPHWADAMRAAGRLVFAPIACVDPGATVRMGGEGPAQWACWAVVSRPRTKSFLSWGALPGAYVTPPGMSAQKLVTGGKQPWLMGQLVQHYSRPGDLVVDPCCGAGTTLVAAIKHGRRAIGGDVLEAHATLAREAVEAERQMVPLRLHQAGQLSIFGGMEAKHG